MATINIKDQTPQRIKMSYEEYLEFAGDAQIVEWVEGEGISYMPPAYKHQNIVGFLYQLLDFITQYFDLGYVILAPFEVKLWPDGPSREPDLFFIRKENLSKLIPERCEGAPDLIIEVISPGSVSEDRVRKFTQYEEAGVMEYWIIDPRPHQQQVDFYVLGKDNMYHAAPLKEGGRYQSTVIPNFWFDVNWLWQEPLPNSQLIQAQIMVSINELPAEVKAAYQTLYKILKP